ncbi:MAG: hypothetical protein MZU91_08525 [Desulfosudis oleivorans]|nr:hypothetical protein [Desulfosudis oleivorans]
MARGRGRDPHAAGHLRADRRRRPAKKGDVLAVARIAGDPWPPSAPPS